MNNPYPRDWMFLTHGIKYSLFTRLNGPYPRDWMIYTQDWRISTHRIEWSLPKGLKDLYPRDWMIPTHGIEWSLPTGLNDPYPRDLRIPTHGIEWSLPTGLKDHYPRDWMIPTCWKVCEENAWGVGDFKLPGIFSWIKKTNLKNRWWLRVVKNSQEIHHGFTAFFPKSHTKMNRIPSNYLFIITIYGLNLPNSSLRARLWSINFTQLEWTVWIKRVLD